MVAESISGSNQTKCDACYCLSALVGIKDVDVYEALNVFRGTLCITLCGVKGERIESLRITMAKGEKSLITFNRQCLKMIVSSFEVDAIKSIPFVRWRHPHHV